MLKILCLSAEVAPFAKTGGLGDVAWIMRENLKKDRLRRMDAAWVKEWGSAVV